MQYLFKTFQLLKPCLRKKQPYNFRKHELSFSEQPPEMFYKKGVLKHFAILTRKHMCRSLFLINLDALRP